MKTTSFLLIIFLILTCKIYAQQTLKKIDVPETPTNLVASGYSTTEIYLTWDDVSNETDYLIYYSTESIYCLIDTTSANVNYYYHNNLTPQTQHCYRVSAINQDGSSTLSNVACASVLSAITEPQINILTLYPNPSNGKFIMTQINNFKTIEISNILGKLIYQTTIENNQNKIEINLSSAPKGIYFVKLDNGEQIRTEKIIIN